MALLTNEHDFRSGCRNVNVDNNSSFQNYTNPDDHTQQTTDTPRFKPFTVQFSILITKCGPYFLGLFETASYPCLWY